MKKDSKEWEDWCAVYEYMKELMGYGSDMKLPKFMVLRLKGLAQGKFMANKKQEAHASYPFSTILITMKMSKSSVNRYISKNQSSFKDEKHKFNGIMVIIESEINDVVMRLKKTEKAEEKIEEIDMSHQERKSAVYKKKSGGKDKRSKLDDIW